MNGIRDQTLGLPVGEMQLLRRLEHELPEASREELASLLNLRVVPGNEAIVGGVVRTPFCDIQVTVSVAVKSTKIAYPPPTKEHPFPVLYARSSKKKPEENAGFPQPYQEAEAFQGVVKSKMGREIYPELLTTWEEVWPWLHRLFRHYNKTNRLDIDEIIAKAIKRQPLTAIPWRERRQWPQEIVVVVDFSRHLCPYFADYRVLAAHLAAWFKGRLKLVVCEDGEMQTFLYNGVRYAGFPLCEENLHILYLGDLGFLDSQGLSPWCWLSLGRELAARNARIEALLTVHPEDWRRQHREFFHCHHWDVGSLSGDGKASCYNDMPQADSRSKGDCEDLLACLSQAFEVTPALARRVRRFLGFSVSVEGLLFQHGALIGNFYSFQWRSQEVRKHYIAKAEDLQNDQEKVWKLIKGVERRLPQELQVEQRQLAGKPLSTRQTNFIWKLIKSLRQQTLDTDASESILAWVGRMAKRDEGGKWSDATNNLFGLYHHLKKPTFVPPGVDLSRVPESLVRRGSQRHIAVLQKQDKLVFSQDDKALADGQAIVEFIADDKATVQLESLNGNTKQLLPVGGDLLLPANITQAVISTATETLTLGFPFCPPWASGIGRDRFGLFAEVQMLGVAFIMRWIPPGSFMMGSSEGEPERYEDEGPQHHVNFARGFWLAETACSQALWRAVMRDNPSRFKDSQNSPELPVENVSQQMVIDFITRLNQQIPGLALRLPSEAEWEYACRAGTTTPFSFGDKLTTADANYDGNHPYNKGKKGECWESTMPAKSFRPNTWGLYQMHGNVWEVCRDHWHENYQDKSQLDGSIPWESGDSKRRVCRGGSWSYGGRILRSACRYSWVLDIDCSGLRLARGPEQE